VRFPFDPRRMMVIGFCLLSWACRELPAAESWPQFRGPNAVGRAASETPLPTQIGPEQNVVWKTALPPGHSSPVVVGDRIYLTTVRDERLLTIALDRTTGTITWEAEAPHEKLEPIHRIGSHAQPSPAADGERVISFFGSSGMYCYDTDGRELWRRPMGPFNNDFGAGTSPIIVDDQVILCQDHDTDSFLTALDKRTGATLWTTDRGEFPRNYCTPVIWEVDGRKQIVVAATLRVVGYDFQTGEELWTVRGLSRAVCMTPVVGEDGNLYVAGWSAGGDINERIALDPFDEFAGPIDANGNGALEESEVPDGPVKPRFTQIDRDKSGSITRAEYDYYRGLFDKSRNVVLAIKPGGSGDVSDSHVLWEYDRYVPFCASPLHYRGRVFTIKDGGILSCLDASSGKPTKQERLDATGAYYSSPVAGDGMVYLLDEQGQLTVISAQDDWQVLHTADFAEGGYATPALVDGRIYLRTAGHLYCFGQANSESRP
jgi:outer membrane protein assembly factor BamB